MSGIVISLSCNDVSVAGGQQNGWEAAGLPAGSRAVLIGVSAYEYAEFPPVRAARNSVLAMRSLLADPALCGWPPDQITVITNPVSAAGLATDIADLAENTTGALLLYYAGHGVLSARGELCLTVTSTRPDRPKISGLPWDTVADVMRGSPASVRAAILDGCFSGQAVEALTGNGAPVLADIAHVEGVYTLTATTRNRPAHVPPPAEQDSACTSFTAELCDLIRAGLPGRPARLTFGDVYPVLRERLRGKGLPVPDQRGADGVGQFWFTANAAATAGATGPGAEAAVRPALRVGPGPAAQAASEVAAGASAQAEQDQEREEAAATTVTRLAGIVADALRAAYSVTDAGQQSLALAAVAKALMATDPGRAGRLVVDAERVAQSVDGDSGRSLALAAVAGPLALTDPGRAERAIASITGDRAKAQALAAVAAALAPTDAGRAAELIAEAQGLAETITGAGQQGPALAAVAEGLAVIDSDQAERLAQAIPEAPPRVAALTTLARAVAATDPDRAARLMSDTERAVQSISGASFRAPALAAVAAALAASDPARAARLIADAERLAQAIPDPNGRASALAAVAEGLAATDPDRAERMAQTITSANARALALAAVAKSLGTAKALGTGT
jgi:hypothetical protein